MLTPPVDCPDQESLIENAVGKRADVVWDRRTTGGGGDETFSCWSLSSKHNTVPYLRGCRAKLQYITLHG